MKSEAHTNDPAALIYRLRDAINAHDLDGITRCFAEDFHSELPATPERSFTGREHVRKNWQGLLAAIPDLQAEVVRLTVDGTTVWTEWSRKARCGAAASILCAECSLWTCVTDSRAGIVST